MTRGAPPAVLSTTARATRRGMTLVELVVGIVVTGLVVIAAYGAFAAVVDRRANAARAAAEVARAAGLRGTLMRWLDGAMLVVTSGTPNGFGTADDGVVRFITRAATPMHVVRTFGRLFVDDQDGHGLIAMLGSERGTDSLRVVLDSAVVALRVEYLVTVGGVRGWRPPDADGSAVPEAVRLRLRADDPALDAALALPIEVPTFQAGR